MTFFNSRNPIYRSPTGAVPAGTRVHFKITVPRSMACSAAYLLVLDTDGRTVCNDMFWCGMNGDDHEWWECHFAPQNAGLCFYHFELRTSRGHFVLKKDIGGEARAGGSEDWQLTAYSADFKTPEWLAGGVLYQIFPDRFYCSGREKHDIPYGRTMHADWSEQPEWRPNAEGKITNTDFFGGDLKGIEQKLGYLKSLGVTCIYLNPIFESHSNHRYDTANYEKIDPLLGTEEDFRSLCAAAKARGIRILLDGVFSHTGSDSIYFNREGRYGDGGAYRSQQSPYYPWYSFRSWPNDYECWWNFTTLPNVREGNPDYDAYINGEDGIIHRWLAAGASGWRLDVADELPDEFIAKIRAAMNEENPDTYLLGEVWEDASNKVSYGALREYFLGSELDATMHYPFRTAVLDFLLGKIHAQAACDAFWTIQEHYPKENLYAALNLIGSHDRARVLTVLGGDVNALKMAMFLQFALPGVPSIYYGDEAGMTGGTDPYNRGSFPWGKGNAPLTDFVRSLTAMYQETPLLRRGECEMLSFGENVLGCRRFDESGSVLALVNRGEEAVECFGVTVPGRGYILE